MNKTRHRPGLLIYLDSKVFFDMWAAVSIASKDAVRALSAARKL